MMQKALLSDDWTVELTKNFEELLTYVNKFEDFKAFWLGEKRPVHLVKKKLIDISQ